jgi:hypothetical protein
MVRWGQRDNRGKNNWGIVGRNGEVAGATPEECRTHWLAGYPVPKDADDDDKVVNFPGSA